MLNASSPIIGAPSHDDASRFHNGRKPSCAPNGGHSWLFVQMVDLARALQKRDSEGDRARLQAMVARCYALTPQTSNTF